MTPVQKEVLSIIRQFKKPEMSDIEAAINVISNHAARIQQQADHIDRLEEDIRKLWETANRLSAENLSSLAREGQS